MLDEPVRGRIGDPSLVSRRGIERARAAMPGLAPRTSLSHLAGLRLTQVGAGKGIDGESAVFAVVG